MCQCLVTDRLTKRPAAFSISEGVAPCSTASLIRAQEKADLGDYSNVVHSSNQKLIHEGISQVAVPDRSKIQVSGSER